MNTGEGMAMDINEGADALTLQFAAAREWGFADFERLDPLTITRSHADAMAAMMSAFSSQRASLLRVS